MRRRAAAALGELLSAMKWGSLAAHERAPSWAQNAPRAALKGQSLSLALQL
jgi:hypothetical protein